MENPAVALLQGFQLLVRSGLDLAAGLYGEHAGGLPCLGRSSRALLFAFVYCN